LRPTREWKYTPQPAVSRTVGSSAARAHAVPRAEQVLGGASCWNPSEHNLGRNAMQSQQNEPLDIICSCASVIVINHPRSCRRKARCVNKFAMQWARYAYANLKVITESSARRLRKILGRLLSEVYWRVMFSHHELPRCALLREIIYIHSHNDSHWLSLADIFCTKIIDNNLTTRHFILHFVYFKTINL